MLIGEFKHTLDSKKRLAIPSKFRKELGQGAVLTRGLDSCLFLFPSPAWNDFVHKVGAISFTQRGARDFSRLMLSGATEVEFDSLGRILIPNYLKNYAGLSKTAVITGVYNRLEIWDEKRWETYKADIEKKSDTIAEKLGELGIV